MSRLKRFVLWPDVHCPFEDKKAVRVATNAIAEFEPDIFCQMGDWGDFWGLSQHRKDPRRKIDVDWEISRLDDMLDTISKFQLERKIYISGNHEWRYDRWIADEGQKFIRSMPSGSLTIKSFPELLDLENKGWEWVDYMESTTIGKLHLTHDTGKSGKNAHLQAELDFRKNAAIGHTHRFNYSVMGSITRETHLGASFGWLGDFDHIDYKHKATARREWVHGFAIGYLDERNHVYLQPMPIVNGSVVINGKLVRA